MTVVSFETEIAAPPWEVWEVVAHPSNLVRWDQHIASVTGLHGDELRRGMDYTTRVRFMGIAADVRVRVLEVRPPVFARLRLSGPIEATVTTSVKAKGSASSVLRHEVEYRFAGGLLGRAVATGLRAIGGAGYALRHGTLAQKRQIEEGG